MITIVITDTYTKVYNADKTQIGGEWFTNIADQIDAYIKTVMTWGYAREEITFIVRTTQEFDTEMTNRAIRMWADGE